MKGFESVGAGMLLEEGGSRIENHDLGQGPESFVIGRIEVGLVEEGVILIENESASEDHLG